jgi:hypothetical protein
VLSPPGSVSAKLVLLFLEAMAFDGVVDDKLFGRLSKLMVAYYSLEY